MTDATDATERACREWLARIARQDEGALAALYDATAARVYALAARLSVNAAMAEEVVADVYLQVWRQAGRYDAARGKVLTWLLTLARSRALDARRRADPAIPHAEPETLVEAPGGGDPVDLLSATEEGSRVRRALESLKPNERQLLALAFFRGMTHQEIAAHTRQPLGTVKTVLRRALQQLRTLLPEIDTYSEESQ